MFETENYKNLIKHYQQETKDCWVQRIKAKEKELFLYITENYKARNFGEKAYLFCNNLGFNQIKCKCGKEIQYNGFIRGYGTCLCRNCSAKSESRNLKTKETLLSKYGVEKINDIPSYKEKRMKLVQSPDWKHKHGNAVKKSMLEKGYFIPTDKKSDFEIYKLAVRRFTTRNKKLLQHDNEYKNIGQGIGKMNIDHIVSKFEGFKNNIPPFIIGSIHNLQILDAQENSRKMHKSIINIDDLLNKFYTT